MKQVYFKLLMPSLVAGSDIHPCDEAATSFVAVCLVKHETTNTDDLTVCHNAELYCRNNENTGYDYNERRNIAIGDIICIEKCNENPIQRYYKYWGDSFELVRLEYNDGVYTYAKLDDEQPSDKAVTSEQLKQYVTPNYSFTPAPVPKSGQYSTPMYVVSKETKAYLATKCVEYLNEMKYQPASVAAMVEAMAKLNIDNDAVVSISVLKYIMVNCFDIDTECMKAFITVV